MKDKYGNRKRIELTEGELALGSWLYITYKVITDEHWDDIYKGKEDYLSVHDFNYYKWRNGCILCTKYMTYPISCGRCPLRRAQMNKGVTIKSWCGCGNNSWYDKVCHNRLFTHSKRISSAINICNVLAKELKKARRK